MTSPRPFGASVDRAIVAMAVAAGMGAWLGGQPGLGTRVVGPLGLVAVGVLILRPVRRLVGLTCICVGLAMVTAVSAQRSIDGLVPPGRGRVQAEMALVSDPAPLPGGGVRAEARYKGKHVAVLAYRSAAAALDDRSAGELITVRGELSPPGTFELRLRHRHLAGRLRVDVVMGWREGHGVARIANGLRHSLSSGAVSLSPRQRSLFLGLVLGDDRAQPPDLTAAFRDAGLAHITAVSGQNVAFMMALVSPLLRRMRIAPRLAVTLGVLALFAVLTRAEPSVLRATAMAAVAAYGAAVGRPTTGLRSLGLAVVGLLLCDPLLVSSLGFRLSVAGAAGIVVVARPLQKRLPGPQWLTAPVAVTLAAQLAVAPLLVDAFGSVALASVPANLLVAPAVGPVMAWGMAAGLVAGAVGGRWAALLHVPTRILLSWIERVALFGARAPLGHISAYPTWAIVAASIALLLITHPRPTPSPP